VPAVGTVAPGQVIKEDETVIAMEREARLYRVDLRNNEWQGVRARAITLATQWLAAGQGRCKVGVLHGNKHGKGGGTAIAEWVGRRCAYCFIGTRLSLEGRSMGPHAAFAH